MLESISPYQLLTASRPKPSPLIVAARQNTQEAAPAFEPLPPMSGTLDIEQLRQPPILQQSRRTHYISDIHSRHIAAQRYLPT